MADGLCPRARAVGFLCFGRPGHDAGGRRALAFAGQFAFGFGGAVTGMNDPVTTRSLLPSGSGPG